MNDIHRLQKLCNINKPYEDIIIWYALADAYEDAAQYSMVDFIRNTSIRYLEWIREHKHKPYRSIEGRYYWQATNDMSIDYFIPTQIYDLLKWQPTEGFISEEIAFYGLFQAWQKAVIN